MAVIINPKVIFRTNWQEIAWLERSHFCLALFLFPLIHVCLKLTNVDITYRFLCLISPQTQSLIYSTDKAKKINQITELTAKFYPRWANCLRKSFTLWYLLKIRGIKSNLLIGARQYQGEFQSHAWVEIHGKPLNETEATKETYQVLVVK